LNKEGNVRNLIESETRLGFTLPWAWVTPAPSVKKEKMRDFVPVRSVIEKRNPTFEVNQK
jgi:hypothetical protein